VKQPVFIISKDSLFGKWQWGKDLRPTGHKTGNIRHVLTSQSLGSVLKKQNSREVT